MLAKSIVRNIQVEASHFQLVLSIAFNKAFLSGKDGFAFLPTGFGEFD